VRARVLGRARFCPSRGFPRGTRLRGQPFLTAAIGIVRRQLLEKTYRNVTWACPCEVRPEGEVDASRVAPAREVAPLIIVRSTTKCVALAS
jgi:hypothetical protein